MRFLELGILAEIFILVFIIFPSSINAILTNNSGICNSKACRTIDEIFLQNIDNSLYTCRNFYDQTCNSSQTLNNLEFRSMHNANKRSIGLLDEINVETERVMPFKIVKKYFDVCKNLKTKNRVFNVMSEIVEKIEFGTDLQNYWDWTLIDWTSITRNLVNNVIYSSRFLFDFDVEPDPRDTSKFLFKINGVPSEDYTSSGIQLLWKVFEDVFVWHDEFIKDLSRVMGTQDQTSHDNLKVIIFDTIRLNKKFNDVMDLNKEYETLGSELMTIKQLSMLVPQIPWFDVIKTFLGSLSNVKIFEDSIIVVKNKQYLEDIGRIIEETPKRIFMNYFIQAAYVEYKYRSSVSKTMTDNVSCVEFIRDKFADVLALLNSRAPEVPDLRNYLGSMAKIIKKQFIDTMYKDWEWMNIMTRLRLLVKMDLIKIVIGYNDLDAEIRELTEFYRGLEYDDDNLLSLELKLYKLKLKRKFEKLKNSENTITYTSKPSYNSRQNMIYIPTEFLQDLWTGKDLPEYVTFATLGKVIAEQIAIGILDYGKNYNPDGQLEDMWDSVSEEEFRKKIECIDNQYLPYGVGDYELNDAGTSVKGVLLETTSIQIAYRAYVNWLHKTRRPQLRLPSFNEIPNRMFFLSVGVFTCRHIDADEERPEAEGWQFFGIPENIPEFGDLFNCTPGSGLNLESNCSMSYKI